MRMGINLKKKMLNHLSTVDKMQFISLTVFLSFAAAAAPLELPSAVTLCKKTDSNCMNAAFTKVLQVFAPGNKKFGIPKMEPLLLKKIHIPGNGGSIDLEQTYTNSHLHGLAKIVPNAITVKASDSEYIFDLELQADELHLIGTYEAKGKMMLFNINGGGICDLAMKNIKGHCVIQCEVYDKEGRSHLRVKKFDLVLLGGTLHMDYENLVNNNAVLSQTILDSANENSDEVFKFLKKDYERMLADALTGIVDLIFSAVPLDKLFLD